MKQEIFIIHIDVAQPWDSLGSAEDNMLPISNKEVRIHKLLNVNRLLSWFPLPIWFLWHLQRVIWARNKPNAPYIRKFISQDMIMSLTTEALGCALWLYFRCSIRDGVEHVVFQHGLFVNVIRETRCSPVWYLREDNDYTQVSIIMVWLYESWRRFQEKYSYAKS